MMCWSDWFGARGMTSPISAGNRSAIGASTSSPRASYDQALDVVAQLADVARPIMRLQHGHGVVADAARLYAGLPRPVRLK